MTNDDVLYWDAPYSLPATYAHRQERHRRLARVRRLDVRCGGISLILGSRDADFTETLVAILSEFVDAGVVRPSASVRSALSRAVDQPPGRLITMSALAPSPAGGVQTSSSRALFFCWNSSSETTPMSRNSLSFLSLSKGSAPAGVAVGASVTLSTSH